MTKATYSSEAYHCILNILTEAEHHNYNDEFIATQCILLLMFSETNDEKIQLYRQFRLQGTILPVLTAILDRGLPLKELFPKTPAKRRMT
jgi:hypothetical protein